jgi:hypothetical protein
MLGEEFTRASTQQKRLGGINIRPYLKNHQSKKGMRQFKR